MCLHWEGNAEYPFLLIAVLFGAHARMRGRFSLIAKTGHLSRRRPFLESTRDEGRRRWISGVVERNFFFAPPQPSLKWGAFQPHSEKEP